MKYLTSLSLSRSFLMGLTGLHTAAAHCHGDCVSLQHFLNTGSYDVNEGDDDQREREGERERERVRKMREREKVGRGGERLTFFPFNLGTLD